MSVQRPSSERIIKKDHLTRGLFTQADECRLKQADICHKSLSAKVKSIDREKITDQELYEALRQKGVLSPADVQRATIETNGKISVIKKEEVGLFKKLFH